MLVQQDIHTQKNEFGLLHHTVYKNELKWYLNITAESVKFLEVKHSC